MQGGGGNDRDAQSLFQLFMVDFQAAFFGFILHVQGDDQGQSQLQQFAGQFQAAGQQGGIDHVDDQVDFFAQQVFPGDLFGVIAAFRE